MESSDVWSVDADFFISSSRETPFDCLSCEKGWADDEDDDDDRRALVAFALSANHVMAT